VFLFLTACFAEDDGRRFRRPSSGAARRSSAEVCAGGRKPLLVLSQVTRAGRALADDINSRYRMRAAERERGVRPEGLLRITSRILSATIRQ
jgi:hypothetical protein